MRILSTTAIAAVLVHSVGASQAATVTAEFEGTIVEAEGGFDDLVGESLGLTIVGDSDASPTVATGDVPPELTGAAASSAVYALSQLVLKIPATGLTITSMAPQLFVLDNLEIVDPDGLEPTQIFDVVAALGEVDGGGSVDFAAVFDAATFAGASIGSAIEQGLANTPTEFQLAGLSIPSARGTGSFDELVADLDLTDLTVDDETSDDGTTDEDTAGDDGTPVSPVPLPASSLLLIASLGGLTALRRRKT